MQACPKQCIAMAADAEGFLYPRIDETRCVSCGCCEKVCPVLTQSETPQTGKPSAYAAYCTDEAIRMASSSGGVFTVLAQQILAQGGVVFGAAFDADWSVRHIAVETTADLSRLRGSKYLQSHTDNTYTEAKQFLRQGRTVLYTGTPCEIEGLKNFLGRSYEKLITQDVICHGVPSQKLWKKYISYQEKCAGASARQMFFRSKKYGWKTYALSLSFHNDKTYVQSFQKDWYMQMFTQNVCLRPSCYNCCFKKLNRVSDLTLADFWGCETVCPELDDDKGLSLVLVHSEKGQLLLEHCMEQLKWKSVDVDKALQGNAAMTQSCKNPPQREMFMRNLEAMDFQTLAKTYLKKPTMIENMYQSLPRNVQLKLKALLRR